MRRPALPLKAPCAPVSLAGARCAGSLTGAWPLRP